MTVRFALPLDVGATSLTGGAAPTSAGGGLGIGAAAGRSSPGLASGSGWSGFGLGRDRRRGFFREVVQSFRRDDVGIRAFIGGGLGCDQVGEGLGKERRFGGPGKGRVPPPLDRPGFPAPRAAAQRR